eukprot:TRINITY_DN7569_c0_g1_i1.p1 TRINITY_DN7569_c0_g1~~TRINITY_DN7569_c0_g1_i1.p1  ORF type:complete len:169 (+),score=22.98 TRINITY_DN7569_c0_g1_i1:68-574(+)
MSSGVLHMRSMMAFVWLELLLHGVQIGQGLEAESFEVAPDGKVTDSDGDGIGSVDTVLPDPPSPSQKKEWRTLGDLKPQPSPTQEKKAEFKFSQTNCTSLRITPQCGVSGIADCVGTFEVRSGVGYTCVWDTGIWPPACVAYRSRSSTTVCLEGTCGKTSKNAPDHCW